MIGHDRSRYPDAPSKVLERTVASFVRSMPCGDLDAQRAPCQFLSGTGGQVCRWPSQSGNCQQLDSWRPVGLA